MSAEQVGAIIDKLKDYHKNEHIRFKWHGGEPLMAGIPFYEYVLANYKEERITHYLQTNLTLINEKWYPIIENLFDGRIGTSFDLSRRTAGSFETFYRIWKKKYEETKKHFDISIRITITNEIVQKGASWLADKIGQFDTDIIILDYFFPNGTGKDNEHKLFVMYHDYHAFASEVKNLCQVKYSNTIVELNNSIIKGDTINGYNDYFCTTCSENMLVIEPDGNVYNCIIMSGTKENCLGNILIDNIEDIMLNTKRVEHIVKHKSFYCDCEYYQNCNGGCYLLKYPVAKNECNKLFAKYEYTGRNCADTNI